MHEDSLRCSIGEMLAIFREALIALIPTADRLLMVWRDEYQHRDWERVAEALFDACVRGPIEADAGRNVREFALPRYDIDVPSYATASWIGVRRDQSASRTALIRLMTDREPFDTVQVAELDVETLSPIRRLHMPFERAEFVFVRRSDVQPDSVVSEIEAVE